jgi:hypothetical protein
MKKTFLTILSIFLIISCSEKDNTKPDSLSEDPVPSTITVQEVARIALVEANQFITNAKDKGIDPSSVTETLTAAKMAYNNEEYKQAQKLAVSVRKQIEKLMSEK